MADQFPGIIEQRELSALRDLEPMYDRLSNTEDLNVVKKVRKDLDQAKRKHAALAIDSPLVQSMLELLEATWVLYQANLDKQFRTPSTFDRVADGITKARNGLERYRYVSSLDDKQHITRLVRYCSEEQFRAATWRVS